MMNKSREMKITTKTDLDISIESIVNVPLEFVYRAHTDPKAIPHWWGPEKYQTTVEVMDIQPGGKWRFIQEDNKGNRHVFFGEFREVVPLEKIIWTFNYEPFPGESVETVEFVALNKEQTKIIVNSVYPSKEARDGMLNSGMETGYSESLERLERMSFTFYETPKVKTCLWFDSQAEEAVNLYVSVIKNSRILSTQRYGSNQHLPEGTVMTMTISLDGHNIMILNGGPTYKLSPALSLYVNCEDQEEVDRLWEALVNGGEESQCGWLIDKFGVSWQIVPKALGQLMKKGTKEQTSRVMKALMPMKKIEISKLEEAFNSV